MNTALALVEDAPRSVDDAVQEINALEKLITGNDSGADRWLWEQADGAVVLLDGGMPQRTLARLWINVREPDQR